LAKALTNTSIPADQRVEHFVSLLVGWMNTQPAEISKLAEATLQYAAVFEKQEQAKQYNRTFPWFVEASRLMFERVRWKNDWKNDWKKD